MKQQIHILTWATDWLVSHGYAIQSPPVMVLETPWSTVIRLSTSTGYFYLKQTPRAIPLESSIIQVLTDLCHASVAEVVAVNGECHGFLMKDAGQTLREYSKSDFQSDILIEAVRQFTAMQRSTKPYLDSFLSLGVPDWRLNTLPLHFERLIDQRTLLKDEGLTDQEIQMLHDLKSPFLDECLLLAQYNIPETLVQPDFNTNNILIDRKTQQLTFIDLGETSITHPFFSLHNYLFQAIKHHGVKEGGSIYQRLQETCLESWFGVTSKTRLTDAFVLSKKMWPIYRALAYHRLMQSVDPQALRVFYAKRQSPFMLGMREYLENT